MRSPGSGQIRGDSSLRCTWLNGIGIRAAWELIRRRKDVVTITEEHEPAFEPPDSGERLDLEEALQRLPGPYRTVVVLHDVEGFGHEEIAALLGVAVGTSRSHLFRAYAAPVANDALFIREDTQVTHNQSDDELTPAEAAAFAALPRTLAGHDDLAEERIVQALKAAKLLTPATVHSRSRLSLVGLGIAASLTLFVAGTLFGRGLATLREVAARSPLGRSTGSGHGVRRRAGAPCERRTHGWCDTQPRGRPRIRHRDASRRGGEHGHDCSQRSGRATHPQFARRGHRLANHGLSQCQ